MTTSRRRINPLDYEMPVSSDVGLGVRIVCERCSRGPMGRKPAFLGELSMVGSGEPTVSTIVVARTQRANGRVKSGPSGVHAHRVVCVSVERTGSGYQIGPCPACRATPKFTAGAAVEALRTARREGWSYLAVMERGDFRGPQGERIPPPRRT